MKSVLTARLHANKFFFYPKSLNTAIKNAAFHYLYVYFTVQNGWVTWNVDGLEGVVFKYCYQPVTLLIAYLLKHVPVSGA